jgi:hypothetical protein
MKLTQGELKALAFEIMVASMLEIGVSMPELTADQCKKIGLIIQSETEKEIIALSDLAQTISSDRNSTKG